MVRKLVTMLCLVSGAVLAGPTDETFHLVIDKDLKEANELKVGKALTIFWTPETHYGLTNGMPIEAQAAIVNQGWQERWVLASNTNKVYLWYGLTQAQIRYAADEGKLQILKDKIIDAGISTNKFMAFRNKTLAELDAIAESRGLVKKPTAEAAK